MVTYVLSKRTRTPYKKVTRLEVRVAQTVEDFMVANVILDRTFGHLACNADYFARLAPACDHVLLAVEVYEPANSQHYSETILGVYLLRDAKLSGKYPASEKYRGLRGLEGVALAVDKSHRNRGAGRLLREYSLTMDYDYIWGMQFRSLNNLDNWIKSGRELIYQTGDASYGINCTARMMPPKVEVVMEPEFEIQDAELAEDEEQSEAKSFPIQFQRDAFSCGATCVEMYLNWTADKPTEVPDIAEIMSLCGTNPQTGTVTEGILDCFQTLGVPAWRSSVFESTKGVTDSEELKEIEARNLNWLEEQLGEGRSFLVRTLTHGSKHWILCYGFYYMNSTRYWLIACPAAGLQEMVDQILVSRWKPRDWDGVVADISFPVKMDDWHDSDWLSSNWGS
jgi:hypothetical protein